MIDAASMPSVLLDDLHDDTVAHRVTVAIKIPLNAELVRLFGELVAAHRKQSKSRRSKMAV